MSKGQEQTRENQCILAGPVEVDRGKPHLQQEHMSSERKVPYETRKDSTAGRRSFSR